MEPKDVTMNFEELKKGLMTSLFDKVRVFLQDSAAILRKMDQYAEFEKLLDEQDSGKLPPLAVSNKPATAAPPVANPEGSWVDHPVTRRGTPRRHITSDDRERIGAAAVSYVRSHPGATADDVLRFVTANNLIPKYITAPRFVVCAIMQKNKQLQYVTPPHTGGPRKPARFYPKGAASSRERASKMRFDRLKEIRKIAKNVQKVARPSEHTGGFAYQSGLVGAILKVLEQHPEGLTTPALTEILVKQKYPFTPGQPPNNRVNWAIDTPVRRGDIIRTRTKQDGKSVKLNKLGPKYNQQRSRSDKPTPKKTYTTGEISEVKLRQFILNSIGDTPTTPRQLAVLALEAGFPERNKSGKDRMTNYLGRALRVLAASNQIKRSKVGSDLFYWATPKGEGQAYEEGSIQAPEFVQEVPPEILLDATGPAIEIVEPQTNSEAEVTEINDPEPETNPEAPLYQV